MCRLFFNDISMKNCSSLLISCLMFAVNLTAASEPKVLLGIDVLERTDFRSIEGNKVGLLTHPAGVNRRGVSTIQILHESPKVDLVALFGPEHGIYGDEKANEPIEDRIDPKTGLPVYSLYGQYRKPTDEMLANLDVMVIDLQDIGVRSYTYVSCMRLVLEACFTNNVHVVVLDRPNPLGGEKTDGPMLDRHLRSYVGAFNVPYVHGLTIGEIARVAKATEGWLEIPETVRRIGRLTIVPMVGWERNMTWNQTGLEWVPTSPAIPSLPAVLGYAMLGLGCEINQFRHGLGTEFPFRLISHPGRKAESLERDFELMGVDGLTFELVNKPSSGTGPLVGVYPKVTDWSSLRPTELSFRMMLLACKIEDRNPYQTASNLKVSLFNKHVGSQEWWDELSKRGQGADIEAFLAKWTSENEEFQKWVRRLYIYE